MVLNRDAAMRELVDLSEALIEAVRFDDSGFNGQGGNGGLLSPETRKAADKLALRIDAWRKWHDPPGIVEVSTPTPPSFQGHRGNWWLATSGNLDGQPFVVKAPIGDGREHVRRAFELIGLPAISSRPTDR